MQEEYGGLVGAANELAVLPLIQRGMTPLIQLSAAVKGETPPPLLLP